MRGGPIEASGRLGFADRGSTQGDTSAYGGVAMSAAQTDLQETQRYFDLLYPDAPDDAYLIVSWRTPRQGMPMKH